MRNPEDLGCAKEETLAQIAKPLLKWYDVNRRYLPWREDPTPYHVWVSEIMLQQTRVEAVKGYYERFMKELPDVQCLAKASEDVLLKLWEGLGYYNRVRNMQKAARTVVEEYGGQIPAEREQLLALAGIGSYTAGAISSIAFGRCCPAVDGNVLRVISRLLTEDQDITKASFKAQIEQSLESVMPKDRPGDFNQALMDIGAMVCLPNGSPLCESCPLNQICIGYRTGTCQRYPVKVPKKPRRIENKTVLVIQDRNRVALHKRPDRGLLAGLYEFPLVDGKLTQEELFSYLKQKGLRALRIRDMGEAKHVFSHIEWHMIGYHVWVDELEPFDAAHGKGFDNGTIFVELAKARAEYAIPSAFAAYTELLKKEG